MRKDVIPSRVDEQAIYRTFVRAVYQDYRLNAVGVPATVAAVLLSAYVAQSPALVVVATIMTVAGIGRYVMGWRFDSAKHSLGRNTDAYRRWELAHTILATFYASMFGLWCAVSAGIGDDFAIFTSFTVTFANLIGVSGRAFPIKRLVTGQAMAASVPLIASLFWLGGAHAFLAILLTPYILSVMLLARRQRTNLLENVKQRRRAQALAQRVNMALENIPQAMCMFDASGTITVTNEHVARFMGLEPRSLVGASLQDMSNLLERASDVGPETVAEFENWVVTRSAPSYSYTFTVQRRQNTHTVRFKAVRLSDGGIVVTMDDVTEEMRTARQIDYMRRFDSLTGLMNRNEVPQHLAQELHHATPDQTIAVVLFNLDRFKELNELHGHRVADDLLCAFSAHLEKLVGPHGRCARMGGDEFVLVIRAAGAADVATHVSDLVIEACSRPWPVSSHPTALQVSCSIGITLSAPTTLEGVCDTMLTEAGLALNAARKNGGACWHVFNQSMRDDMQAHHQMQEDLRLALELKQFEPHFQPLVSTTTGEVTTCEALLRWQRADGSMVPPGLFIPMAEEMGIICPIGNFILAESCRIAATWPGNTRVAVNLSPLQFAQGDLPAVVNRALDESGLAPDRLELEITESLMLDDMDSTIATLLALKKRGVRISLDDFGTGYSSLSYLNQLPLDKVKIDRSFVTDLETNPRAITMVQAVAALSQELGLKVVVEGIETPEQLALLLSVARVDEIQGYLLSRPVPGGELRPRITAGTPQAMAMAALMQDATPNIAA